MTDVLIFLFGFLCGVAMVILYFWLLNRACDHARRETERSVKAHHADCVRAYRRGRDWKRFD